MQYRGLGVTESDREKSDSNIASRRVEGSSFAERVFQFTFEFLLFILNVNLNLRPLSFGQQ
jgi:hypothetical protein